MRKKKKQTIVSSFTEIECPVCEKLFIPAYKHAYRDKRVPYKRVCSWGCVCTSERLKEEEKAERENKRKRVKPGES